MTEPLGAFLNAAAAAADLLSAPEVAKSWERPSALAEFRVSGLAGHLVRATTTVETYLAAPPPDAAPIGAGEYYARLASSDISQPANQAVRARGEETAAGGPAEVARQAHELCHRLSARLPGEDMSRPLAVGHGLVVTLSEYLRTRVVELVVHSEDLALSVGVTPVPPTPAAASVAIETLVEVARARHGDVPVLRALARRERDAVDALRVL